MVVVLVMVRAMMIGVLLLRVLHLFHLTEVLAEQVNGGILLASCVLVVSKPLLLLVLWVSLATVRSPGLDDATSGL